MDWSAKINTWIFWKAFYRPATWLIDKKELHHIGLAWALGFAGIVFLAGHLIWVEPGLLLPVLIVIHLGLVSVVTLFLIKKVDLYRSPITIQGNSWRISLFALCVLAFFAVIFSGKPAVILIILYTLSLAASSYFMNYHAFCMKEDELMEHYSGAGIWMLNDEQREEFCRLKTNKEKQDYLNNLEL